MSSSSGKILVLGSGELGSQVMSSIIGRKEFANTPISVLQRSSSLPSSLSQTVRETIFVEQCDLNTSSIDDLSAIFKPYTTIICCTGFVGGAGTQMKITKAVIQAQGPRKLYIPWQFGIDYDKIGRGSGQIVWDEQLDVRDSLRSQDKVDWLIISTGMFTSFLFEPSFGIVNKGEHVCRALGSWGNMVTVTCVEDIGRCVAGILTQSHALKNRIVYIGGDTVSYRQIADVVAKRWQAKGIDAKRDGWTLHQLKAELDKKPDDLIRMYRYAFAKGTGMSWSLDDCWNVQEDVKLLSVSEWCDAHSVI